MDSSIGDEHIGLIKNALRFSFEPKAGRQTLRLDPQTGKYFAIPDPESLLQLLQLAGFEPLIRSPDRAICHRLLEGRHHLTFAIGQSPASSFSVALQAVKSDFRRLLRSAWFLICLPVTAKTFRRLKWQG